MKYLHIFIILVILFPGHSFAHSPFDVFYQNVPDIAISDIVFNPSTLSIDANICNVGADMDRAGDLLLGVKKTGHKTRSVSVPEVRFSRNSCRIFRVVSLRELGITENGNYSLSAGVQLQGNRLDPSTDNNVMTRSIRIVFPNISNYSSPSTVTHYQPPYGSATQHYGKGDLYIKNVSFVASLYLTRGDYSNSVLTDAIVADICNGGSSFSSHRPADVSFIYAGRTAHGYPESTYSLTWSNGECRRVGVEARSLGMYANGSYSVGVHVDSGNAVAESNETNNKLTQNVYVSLSGQYPNDSHANYYTYNYGSSYATVVYPNGGQQFNNNTSGQFTVRAEIGTHPGNVDSIDIMVYKKTHAHSSSSDHLYKTETMRAPFGSNSTNSFTFERTFFINGWPDGEYYIKIIAYDNRRVVIAQDNSDGTFTIGSVRPDLVVRNITQDASSRFIRAEICNEGTAMKSRVTLQTEFSTAYNNRSAVVYSDVILGQNACRSHDVHVTPEQLGIHNDGTYSVTARTDVSRIVEEKEENNNASTASVSIRTLSADRPDLVIENIYQDAYSRNLITRVCNRGGDMTGFSEWNMVITNENNNLSTTRYFTDRLHAGGCQDYPLPYGNLNIGYSGAYTIRASVDEGNKIQERNEYNNTLIRGIYIGTY